jgi:methylaspartate ammonia-lyase
MRAMAKRVQRDLAERYVDLAKAYEHLAQQREELVAVRAKLEQTLIETDTSSQP